MGEVHQVVDETQEQLSLIVHRVQRRGALRGGHLGSLTGDQQLDVAEHGGQRGPQFVADRGHHLVPGSFERHFVRPVLDGAEQLELLLAGDHQDGHPEVAGMVAAGVEHQVRGGAVRQVDGLSEDLGQVPADQRVRRHAHQLRQRLVGEDDPGRRVGEEHRRWHALGEPSKAQRLLVGVVPVEGPIAVVEGVGDGHEPPGHPGRLCPAAVGSVAHEHLEHAGDHLVDQRPRHAPRGAPCRGLKMIHRLGADPAVRVPFPEAGEQGVDHRRDHLPQGRDRRTRKPLLHS